MQFFSFDSQCLHDRECQHIPLIIHRQFGLIHTELNDLFAFHFMQRIESLSFHTLH